MMPKSILSKLVYSICPDCTLKNHIEQLEHDIQKLREENTQLRIQACVEPLTGCYRKEMAERLLKSALAHAKRYNEYLTILFIDLDKFKHVNDTYGHDIGDRVLKEVGTILRTELREGDTIRNGGDEFLTIHPHTNQQESKNIIKRLKTRIQKKRIPLVFGSDITISASIGSKTFNPDDEIPNIESFIKSADANMYFEKTQTIALKERVGHGFQNA